MRPVRAFQTRLSSVSSENGTSTVQVRNMRILPETHGHRIDQCAFRMKDERARAGNSAGTVFVPSNQNVVLKNVAGSTKQTFEHYRSKPNFIKNSRAETTSWRLQSLQNVDQINKERRHFTCNLPNGIPSLGRFSMDLKFNERSHTQEFQLVSSSFPLPYDGILVRFVIMGSTA